MAIDSVNDVDVSAVEAPRMSAAIDQLMTAETQLDDDTQWEAHTQGSRAAHFRCQGVNAETQLDEDECESGAKPDRICSGSGRTILHRF